MSKKSITEIIPEVEAAPAAPAPALVPIAVAAPALRAEVIPCQDCKHWRKPWPKANVGECDVSRRFLASPIYTPGLASCEDAEL